jgi:hypothetical protein
VEPVDPRPFVERYRGTPWDSSPPPPTVILVERRAPFSWPLALAGVVLVGVVIGAVAMVARPKPTGLAAFVQMTTEPATMTTRPRPTPALTTESPPLTTQPPLTMAPSLPTATLPAGPGRAFVARMLDPNGSYTLAATGAFLYGNEDGTFKFQMDVAGPDLDGSFTLAENRVRTTALVIVKDGVEYVRPAGEPWMRQSGIPSGMPGDLFAGKIPAADWMALEYVGAEQSGGERLHHLRLPIVDWRAFSRLILEKDDGGTINELSFDIWVTDTGEPRTAEFKFDAVLRAAGVEADITFSMSYQFSRFGEKFVIEAPARFVDDEQQAG